MCGIVGAISAKQDVTPLLVDGLKCLEYRGYDSAGIALAVHGRIERRRVVGKVHGLVTALAQAPVQGALGIAHTRWATHGEPSERNAHPHISQQVAVVHNGIIENYAVLRAELISAHYMFSSQTDTEVIVHLIDFYYQHSRDFFTAVQQAVARLHGAYALAIIHADYPHRLLAIRSGSPLVVGLGEHENFLASDAEALLSVTRRFIYLKEGDMADIYSDYVVIYDAQGDVAARDIKTLDIHEEVATKGEFDHFMQKEIFEQAEAIQATLEGRMVAQQISTGIFDADIQKLFKQVQSVHIVACGTSYHAGLVARYWLEEVAQIACHIEVASEFRYRKSVVPPYSLLVAISQSGETADSLAALRQANGMPYWATLVICNRPESTLVREADCALMTRAGREIGVASTKAFTTQLVALLLLTLTLRKSSCTLGFLEDPIVMALEKLPSLIQKTLQLDAEIKRLASLFQDKTSVLFLGRGTGFPVALEGALKLKEISYIHAEGYAAGELKHGPIALIDAAMPVVVVAPSNTWLEKLKSNMEEVRSRGGQLIVFTDKNSGIEPQPHIRVFILPEIDCLLAPILYSIPLQLLAYHVAVARGNDVDQPRNLAKSVTVE